MKSKIGFVAIGQAGGNIGKLLEQKGFSVLYLNTSTEDLDTLQDVTHKYHITGGEGCNHDRQKAKQLVIDDFDNIAQEIDNKIGDKEILFVIFASGGGTGSGAGPMLVDLLTDEGKKIGIISVLPGIKESVKFNINAYECFSELTQINGSASTFIIDNDKGDKLTLNSIFVDNFCDFIDIPSSHKSIKGNIDKAEIIEALIAHGSAIVISTNDNKTTGIISAITENPFAKIETDRVIKYISISACGEFDIEDIEKAVGIPLDTFQTDNKNKTLCMLSGLSYPHTRLDAIYDKVKTNKEVIIKNLKATSENSLKSDINFLSEVSVKQSAKEDKKPKSKRDIMNKYLKD